MVGRSAEFLYGELSGVCGKTVVPLKGTVVMNGKPIKLEKNEGMVLKFLWTAPDGRPCMASATVQPDGAFTVQGPQNKGLPPADYKIAVSWNVRTIDAHAADLPKEVYKKEDKEMDKSSPKDTPLQFTVELGGIEELVIDVGDTPSVTKK